VTFQDSTVTKNFAVGLGGGVALRAFSLSGTAPMVSVYVMTTMAEWRANSRLFVAV
jgi:hypothetical protein